MPTQKYKTKAGKIVPGTTTIIGTNLGWGKDALMYWAWERGMEGEDFRAATKAAADAGTLAHAMAEHDILGKPWKPPADADPEALAKAGLAYSSYLEWKKMTKIELLESETPYVSEEYEYGGTIDAVGRIAQAATLVDFKTSNGLYANHIIQCAAYANLWEHGDPDQHRVLMGGVHILRFSRDGGHFHHHYYRREALEPAFSAFLRLRTLHSLKKQIEGMT